MSDQPDTILQAITYALAALASEQAPAPLKEAFRQLKERMGSRFGSDSPLLKAIMSAEEKPDSRARQGVVQEEIELCDAAADPALLAIAQKILGGGDEIDIHSGGDVAFSKDNGVAIILKKLDLTVQTAAIDVEKLIRTYLAGLAADTNHLPWASVDKDYADPSQGESLELVHIYTALDTTTLERLDSEDAVRKHLSRQREARRISAQEMIDTHPRLVLLGDPGSGKSTLVNYLTHVMAKAGIADTQSWMTRLKQNGPWSHGLMLPIRVVLRDFAAALPDSRQTDSADHILDHLKHSLKDTDFWPVLHEALLDQKAPCLILLDGLDEVPTDRRGAVVRIIDNFAARHTGHRYLVTCRIYAYIGREYQLRGFQQATLTPFNPEQIERFITTWYHELYKRGRFTEKDSEDRAEKLMTAATRPDLAGLAERPLLMTVMALLHTYRGELPDDRVELYQWTVDLLLRRWEGRYGQEKGILDTLAIPGLKMTDLEAGLYDVAYQAHAGGSSDGETADIREGDLRERLAPYLNHDWNKAGEFVAYVRDRAGLLIRHKPDAYTFPHRTFQEFMAACHLVNMPDYTLEVTRLLAGAPDRWRIVFILSAGYAARTHRLGLAIAAVSALCPEGVGETECAGPAGYRLAVIAGEALLEIGLVGVKRETIGKALLLRIRKWLTAAMQADKAIEPKERVEAGNVLSRLGDPRFDPDKWHLPVADRFGFVTIPAGPFLMGSDEKKDPYAIGHELPQHTVILSVYEIARHPVTVAQYRVFAEETDREMDDDWRKYNRHDNHPVVEVDWHDAAAYCDWLTERLNSEGFAGKITLPTEAQWEKAARGADGRIYPWGDSIEPNRANYDDTGIESTSPVGCFPDGESPYGLLDMAGNVWEWTSTIWGDDFNKPDFEYPYIPDDGREDPASMSSRVLRGGAWNCDAGYCRTAYRLSHSPDHRGNGYGFRLVCLPGQRGEPSR